MELVALPSIVVQTATVEHVLIEELQNRPVDVELQSVIPQVQSLSFTDRPLATTHAFDDVMFIVSTFQARAPFESAVIGVGLLRENSGRATSSAQKISTVELPSVEATHHCVYCEFQYKKLLLNLYVGLPFRSDPNQIYLPIRPGSTVDPDNVTSPGTKPAVQKLKDATHLRPVATVQSVVPQAQSMELASLPSVVVHDESCALTPRDIDENSKQRRIRTVV